MHDSLKVKTVCFHSDLLIRIEHVNIALISTTHRLYAAMDVLCQRVS